MRRLVSGGSSRWVRQNSGSLSAEGIEERRTGGADVAERPGITRNDRDLLSRVERRDRIHRRMLHWGSTTTSIDRRGEIFAGRRGDADDFLCLRQRDRHPQHRRPAWERMGRRLRLRLSRGGYLGE